MPNPVNIAIVGAAGYAGAELARLLASHPGVRAASYVSRSAAGSPVSECVPALRGSDAAFAHPDSAKLEECDAVFFAAPHGVAMKAAPALVENGVAVIDLGPDFRLRDPALYEKWYGQPHAAPELLTDAVYGLTEAAREKIPAAKIIACPGCHATAMQLALLPFVKAKAVAAGTIAADSKTGVSGAGKSSGRSDLLMAEMHGNCKAYAVNGHRHLPETLQALAEFGECDSPEIVFVPHLLPLSRGILLSAYVPLRDDAADPAEIVSRHWRDAIFVDALSGNEVPELTRVAFSNRTEILARKVGNKTALVLAALDNLMKGAAGQAVQNFNLRFGFAEDEGLRGGGLLG